MSYASARAASTRVRDPWNGFPLTRVNPDGVALSRVVLLRLMPTGGEFEPRLQLKRRNSPMLEHRLLDEHE